MTRDGLRLFYIPPAAVQGERVVLGAEESAHIRRVLKMKVGAICRAATSEGQEYKIELTEITASESTARIIERLPKRPSSPLSIALGLPLLKGERFEWVLQKGCELGADAFYPLMLERCEARIQEKRSAERHRRWRRIVLEAAKQCDRVPPPVAHPLGDLESFLAETKDFDLKLMGYLGEHAMSAKEALSRVRRDSDRRAASRRSLDRSRGRPHGGGIRASAGFRFPAGILRPENPAFGHGSRLAPHHRATRAGRYGLMCPNRLTPFSRRLRLWPSPFFNGNIR